MVDDRTLASLQDLLLERVLSSTALPGQDAPLAFPDLAYVTNADVHLLLATGYVGASGAVTVVTDVPARARDEQIGVLEFQEPLDRNGDVTLRLRVVLPFPELDPLPLGEIVATFTRRADEWTTTTPTHALAF